MGVELTNLGRLWPIPGTVHLREHSVRRDRNYATLDEPGNCRAVGHLAHVPGGIHDGVHLVSRELGIERREHHADAGPNSCHHKGHLSGGTHGPDEVLIVPGINFTLAAHVYGM